MPFRSFAEKEAAKIAVKDGANSPGGLGKGSMCEYRPRDKYDEKVGITRLMPHCAIGWIFKHLGAYASETDESDSLEDAIRIGQTIGLLGVEVQEITRANDYASSKDRESAVISIIEEIPVG